MNMRLIRGIIMGGITRVTPRPLRITEHMVTRTARMDRITAADITVTGRLITAAEQWSFPGAAAMSRVIALTFIGIVMAGYTALMP